MSIYVKSYDSGATEWMYVIFDGIWRIMETSNDTWNKVRNRMKKEFGSKPLYNKTTLNTAVKSYAYKATDYQDK